MLDLENRKGKRLAANQAKSSNQSKKCMKGERKVLNQLAYPGMMRTVTCIKDNVVKAKEKDQQQLNKFTKGSVG